MSEGELKKRIREEAKEDYYFQVPEEDLIKWLDEAKKEFEAIWDKWKPIDWIYHAGQIYLELKAWKKKWFGDST